MQQALPEMVVQGQPAPIIPDCQGFSGVEDAVRQEGVDEIGAFRRTIQQRTDPSTPKPEKAAQRGKPCGRHCRLFVSLLFCRFRRSSRAVLPQTLYVEVHFVLLNLEASFGSYRVLACFNLRIVEFFDMPAADAHDMVMMRA